MIKCDVIIPVYNAYDCLKPCIESVLKNTDMKCNRLILIDDKSPDERVLPLLNSYHNGKSVIVLKNDENLGFVGTVNKGMSYSKDNDVLLLNSDTEVTKDWLKKIQECAYSREDIATVTPLSNNATLVSVPKSFVPNDIPKGYTLEEFAEIVDKASYKDYPEVPTGHGFCLFIKRSALDVVGLFDAESYGKGYGEENDFCFRCLDAGLKSVVCDNAYVYHKESQSFSEAKGELIKQGLETLERKYPSYKNKLDIWVQSRSIDYIGNNINFELGKKYQDRPNVLFVIHDWKNVPDNLGGTTLHAWDIIRKLIKYYNFHILAIDNGIYKVYSYWGDVNNKTVIQYHSVKNFSQNNFYNEEYSRMFQTIIDKFNINCVHIHHLIGHYFDVIDVSKKNNLKVIITLHDYYFACPQINKLYLEKQYCDNPSIEKCYECFKAKYTSLERSSQFINSWRNVCEKELKKCDLIICPSKAAKEEMLKTYKDLDISVIEHGIDINKVYKAPNIDKEYFEIAFLGAIGNHKGSNIMIRLVKSLDSTKIRLHLFGILDRPFKSSKHYIDHGKYKREDLDNILQNNDIDLICLFSIWPETYSYTLTESVACGIPVVAFDFGAIAERIKKYNLGYVIPLTDDETLIRNEIIKIRENKEEYLKKIESIKEYNIKSTDEMDEEYKIIYKKNKCDRGIKIDNDYIKDKIKESSIPFGNLITTNYEWVFSTLKWKIISKFKIPQPIKNVYRKIKKD